MHCIFVTSSEALLFYLQTSEALVLVVTCKGFTPLFEIESSYGYPLVACVLCIYPVKTYDYVVVCTLYVVYMSMYVY